MIRVLTNYGGRNTAERRIEPGDYAEDDPRLFGAADDMLASGHAVRIGLAPEPVTLTTAPGGEVLLLSDDPTPEPEPVLSEAEAEMWDAKIADEPPVEDDEPDTKPKGKRR